jgi:hypothetical protein
MLMSQDVKQKAVELVEAFGKEGASPWERAGLFLEINHADKIKNTPSTYPVRIDSESISEMVAAQGKREVLENMLINKDEDLVARLVSGKQNYVPFNALTVEMRRKVLRDYIKRVFVQSHSVVARRQADQRNRLQAFENIRFKEGDYVHYSPVRIIDDVLRDGNIAGEFMHGRGTSIPLHAEFGRISKNAASYGSVSQVIGSTASIGIGEEDLLYVYSRNKDSWEEGKFYGPHKGYAAILGGMPSTETSAIIIKNKELLPVISRSILNNGFYIPIYDFDGALLFSPDQYDKKQAENGGIDFNADKINLQVQNNGGEIKFHIDPAMLAQLQNAPGFVPVIIHIQPLKSLPEFLGLNQGSANIS